MALFSRRQALRLAATGGLGSLLGACGVPSFATPPTPTPATPTTVVVWNWLDDAVADLVAEFERANPLVRVRLERVGYQQAYRQFVTALQSGTGAPDVFITDRTMLGMLREQPGLTDLAAAPFDGAALRESFVSWAWQATGVAGRQVALPWAIGVGTAWYRADVFARAGLPTDPAELQAQVRSWDDWLALDEMLQRALPDHRLVAESRRLFAVVAAQQGGGWLTGDRLDLARRALPAAEFVAGLQRRGVPAELRRDEIGPSLVTGTAAGFVDAAWNLLLLQQNVPTTAGSWRMIRPPGGDFSVSALALLIPQQSLVQEAAWSLVRALCATTALQNLALQSAGVLPAFMPAWADPLYDRPVGFFGDQPAFRVLTEAAQAQPEVVLSRYDAPIEAALANVADGVASGSVEPLPAIEAAEQALRRQYPEL